MRSIGRIAGRAAVVVAIGLAGLVPLAAPTAAANPAPVTGLDAGYYHACAIRSSGTVWCWGWALYGQLGDGTTGDQDHRRTTPVQVRSKSGPLTGIKAVSVSIGHGCALGTDGRAWCWGTDSIGELGDGTYGDDAGRRLRAVRVRLDGKPMAGISQIAAGNSFTCFLRSGGVWCVGLDEQGQLGDGTTGGKWHGRLNPVHVRWGDGHLTRVRALVAGNDHTCAARADGSVWCWGSDVRGQLGDGGPGTRAIRTLPVRVRTASGFLDGIALLAAGVNTTCGSTSGGALWCWGDDEGGQAGDGASGVDRIRHRAIRAHAGTEAGDDVRRMSLGGGHTCVASQDGTPWCWGWAYYGQTGDGTHGSTDGQLNLLPVQVTTQSVPLTNVKTVSAGFQFTCELDGDGVVWCHGANADGQLGNGSAADPQLFATPVLFP